MPGQAYRQYKGELNSLLRRFLFQIQLELREQTRESQSDEKIAEQAWEIDPVDCKIPRASMSLAW